MEVMRTSLTRSGRGRRRALGLLAASAFLLGTAACNDAAPTTTATASPTPAPVLTPAGARQGVVSWAKPLVLSADLGTLRDVSVTDPRGYPVQGTLADGTWTSATTLLPGAAYHVAAEVTDQVGAARRLDLTVRTSKATKTLRAVHSPRSDRVVGVGLPAIVTLSRSVNDPEDRRAVVSKLRVVTEPQVDGAWRWISPKELHYRGAHYWAKGTSISVHSDLDGLRLSGGVWGEGSVDTRFRVGSAVIATVDVAAKSMVVTVDGKVVRTLKVSTGRPEFPTKGGVHLVLEKTKLEVMDSATVGIPRSAPGGYYLKVPNSVRISYGGAFVHSASWSVRDQGVRNVSHGCVNLSPADSAWYFDLVKRGDVVSIVNAVAKPRLSDPGTADWNIPFEEWAN
jgi:lipoprotein-anchoring transpeptidase ErfK/SrfK